MEQINEKQFELMNMIANEVKVHVKQVKSVIELTNEGNTIPFIARYRKERTGALDEVAIRQILERWQYVQNLETRKQEVIKSIEEQGKLTDELENQIQQATKVQEVEDLYRPFKQQRRTKASIAKERGLEPLAQWILTFPEIGDLTQEAEKFINAELEVNQVEDAIAGAKDIIAEFISDQAEVRKWIRFETMKHGVIQSKVKNEEKDEKRIFEMYYEYEEPVSKVVHTEF